jgi:endonuclease/exonuclease/phosphatase family metal-dependent hydrolase
MARSTVRRFTKGFFKGLNIFIAFIFLLSCLAPYLNPATWWFMGFLGLMFPYLALLLIIYVIFWWVVKPAVSIISILTLLVGWKQFSVLWGFTPSSTFVAAKASDNIRIIDWNIRSFQGLSNKLDKKRLDRLSIANAINSRNPDIICMQEFNNSVIQNNFNLFEKYPYRFFSKDFKSRSYNYEVGSVIFSRHPIKDTGRVKYPGPNAESLIYADIETPSKVIRVYTTHLQSFKFNQSDYEGMDKIKNTEEAALHASKSLFQKMKIAFTKRGEQARLVREALNISPHPSVLCADFNDVPNSYTYFHIRSNWHDAFLQLLCIGRTYLGVAPLADRYSS